MGNIGQVKDIVNSASKEFIGKDAIHVENSSDLVSLGTQVLGSALFAENFTNGLVSRIGKTIMDYKAYNSKLSGLLYDDFSWGAIVQKIHVEVGEAEDDPSVDLPDGGSIDMYKITKPKVEQKFWYKRAAWMFKLTIQKVWLSDAFLSPSAMGSFLNYIEGQMRNKMEIANESLGKLCISNAAGLTYGSPRQVHVLTEYNNATGAGLAGSFEEVLHDEGLLRFLSELYNNYRDFLSQPNVFYNASGYTKFTSANELRMISIGRVANALKSQVLWNAFHQDLLSLGHDITVPYWQNPQDPFKIMVQVNSSLDDANPKLKDVEIDNLLSIMYDKRAMGTYRQHSETATTPYNAAGRYTNTFWHEDKFYFNDLDEQMIIFTLD